MEKLTIIYSVQNGGDGSAYPRLMESMELAEWDQENQYEGWGESCTGTIEVESDSPIKIVDGVQTAEETFLEMDEDKKEKQKKFLDQFFPEGFPLVYVEFSNNEGYYDVFRTSDEKFLFKKFAWPKRTEEARRAYQIEINSLSTVLKSL